MQSSLAIACLLLGFWTAPIFALINPFPGLGGGCPSVFISQYYEGVGTGDKHIELFNYGRTTVNLASLSLGVWTDSKRQGFLRSIAASTLYPLTGAIAPGRSFVISNPSFTKPSYVTPDLRLSLAFSGDDSVILMTSDGLYCDILSVNGNVAQDTSFTRKRSVWTLQGSYVDNFALSDWDASTLTAVDGAARTTPAYLGYHAPLYPAAFQPRNVTVASFNIQIFGQSKMAKPDVVTVLLRILRRYDIVAIMEIRDSDGTAFPSFMTQLNAFSRKIYQSGEVKRLVQYQSFVGERLGRSNTKEQYAFVYDPELVTLLGTHPYDQGTSNTFERSPLTGYFRIGDLTFSVIVVHTKPTDAVNELDAMADVYDQMIDTFGNRNAIILGDFNAGCSYVPQYKFAQIRLFTEPRFTWLIDNKADTTVEASVCAYDRFVIAGDVMSSIVPNSAMPFLFPSVYKLNAQLASAVSDHYPIELLLTSVASSSVSSPSIRDLEDPAFVDGIDWDGSNLTGNSTVSSAAASLKTCWLCFSTILLTFVVNLVHRV